MLSVGTGYNYSVRQWANSSCKQKKKKMQIVLCKYESSSLTRVRELNRWEDKSLKPQYLWTRDAAMYIKTVMIDIICKHSLEIGLVGSKCTSTKRL